MVIGKGENNGASLKILLNEVYPMEKVREKFTKSIVFSINVKDVQENTIVALRQLMEQNRGRVPCYFSVTDSKCTKVYQTSRYSVEPSEKFVEEVRRVLGPNSIAFSPAPPTTR